MRAAVIAFAVVVVVSGRVSGQTIQPGGGDATVVVQGAGGNLHVTCDSGCAAGSPGQQTMAASAPVVIASNQSAVPVTLATAPTTPVTGTFWQLTQPVSLATTPTTPVTGTFWQVTQPVSGTVTTAPPATAFSCQVNAVTSMTQCQAAPGGGLRAYVTSVMLSNQAATAVTIDVVYGTGSNCATGPTPLTHKIQFGTANTTTNGQFVSQSFATPLVPAVATAICLRPSAATAFGGTVTGYIAP